MPSVWTTLISIGIGLVTLWLALIVALLIVRPHGAQLREVIRLAPDLIRLLTRLARDRDLPRGVRMRLGLLMAYLAMPFDLVPDFIPVLGYADDAIIIAAVLRTVVRRAGVSAVRRHWPGSDDGLAAVERLARISAA